MQAYRRWVRFVVLTVSVAFWIGCAADRGPTGVPLDEPINPSLLGSLLKPTGLLSCSPLPYATATETIGPDGGVIEVGPHRLYIPPRALSDDVTITAEAPTGDVNLVTFEPHGLSFERPVALRMSYANCSVLGILLPKRIAYTSDLLAILEFLPSVDDFSNSRVTGKLDHFSGYALAW